MTDVNEATFSSLGLGKLVCTNLEKMGYTNPTPVQEEAIPFLLKSTRNLVAGAQTGTGKTAAFSLPIIEALDVKVSATQALILTPTRELASQVESAIKDFSAGSGLKTMTIVGGQRYDRQIEGLTRRKPQVVVSTPGRLIDLLKQGYLKLDHVKHFVLDEADEMLNMGFYEDVEKIVDTIPSDARMLMFSATMPAQIQKLIDRKFSEPHLIQIKRELKVNQNIEQKYSVVHEKDQKEALARIIEQSPDLYAMVFCRTKVESKEVADGLSARGVMVDVLNGDMGQRDRDYVMKKFKDKRVKVLVCTDVAARGIDVDNLTHVFNFGLPQTHEAYVHRIGRTARAGATGIAHTIIGPRDVRVFRSLERFTRVKMINASLPCPQSLQLNHVARELGNVAKLLGSERRLSDVHGDAFDLFSESFADMEKEDVVELMFQWKFEKAFKVYGGRRLGEILEEDLRSFAGRPGKPAKRRGGKFPPHRGRRGPSGGGSGHKRSSAGSRKPQRARKTHGV